MEQSIQKTKTKGKPLKTALSLDWKGNIKFKGKPTAKFAIRYAGKQVLSLANNDTNQPNVY